jgi:toxin FitB
MIPLDTNVVSEAVKPVPDLPVLAWLDAHSAGELFLSSVTVAELVFGAGILPNSRRKDLLVERIERLMATFADRVLPFDVSAARHYADLAVNARRIGRGFPTPDGYIAAIAADRGFAVASRDRSAFAAAGLAVIDPWTAPA